MTNSITWVWTWLIRKPITGLWTWLIRKPLTGLWNWLLRKPPIVRRLLVLLAVVVVTALAIPIVRIIVDDSCAPGVSESEDDEGNEECTGVTDGGYAFFDSLGPVSARIKAENDRVTAGTEPYATVALMIPMTPKTDNATERTQVLREVQGAYLAQRQANARGLNPPIRLVLANPGRQMTRRLEVAADLVERSKRGNDERLRAVFGFNLSIEPTKETIKYLTDQQIAVVGGPITADSLGNDRAHPNRYPGLAKVVPSNRDQARALAGYLGVEPQDTFLVEDTHDIDIYARDLRIAFREITRGTPHAPEQYDARKVIPSDFEQMVNNLCDSRATTVYFAGRPPELTQLVNALGKRGCVDRHFRLVTVSGASTLALDPAVNWGALTQGEGLAVEYATITHENAWTANNPPRTGGSSQDFMALRNLVNDKDKIGDIGPFALADGRTITMYDSAMTAIAGIRNRTDTKGEVPDAEDISAAWPRLHGDQKVRGASGWICLTSYGTPYDKAVAIVRLTPAPGQHIQFVRLAWPERRPPGAECKAGPD